MKHAGRPLAMIDEVLKEELRHPFYLTEDEVRGGWRSLFPELAESLGSPYPVYCKDETRVVLRGYPVLLSSGVIKLQSEIMSLIEYEIEFRLAPVEEREGEKRRLMGRRSRYSRSMTAIIENTLVNDYGRGLFDVFLLFHSADIARGLKQIPAFIRRRYRDSNLQTHNRVELSVANTFAELIQNASMGAVENLKKVSHIQMSRGLSSLLTIICQDQLLLLEPHIPTDLDQVPNWVRARVGIDAGELKEACVSSAEKLRDVVDRQPAVGNLMSMIAGIEFRNIGWRALLEPRLLDAIEAAHLTVDLEIPDARIQALRDLGRRLKRFELLNALRKRVLRMEKEGNRVVLSGADKATPIASSTRPFDFASPGVVSSAVHRFGLIYDLTNFTTTLEAVRKKGHQEEERALRLMYVFQNQLEAIRRRRRLNFEKFLGDGAFYSARRGLRVLAAGCEIQCLYDDLRRSAFPFDLGIRIAMNFGGYHLLPMWTREPGIPRFEFFGHGIVELARLTTGKSTRELEEISDFLLYSGYDPGDVDSFLGPLMMARGEQRETKARRPYSAVLDERGELVNEGIVMTLPFLGAIEESLVERECWTIDFDELRWLVFALDPERQDSLMVGLRHLGVTRLKGLQPTELIEAAVWRERPAALEAITPEKSMIDVLRALATDHDESEPDQQIEIPHDLVVITFSEGAKKRHWIFGEYRSSDDVLLHAIHVPIKADDLGEDDVVEVWLLKNRVELAQIYSGLRQETSGLSTPLGPLRKKRNYNACYLSAPHRSPG